VEWHLTGVKPGSNSDPHVDRSQSTFPETSNVAYGNKRDKEHLMLDVLMLALGLGFFAAGIGYAYACERL
jgi:hypothetical protein